MKKIIYVSSTLPESLYNSGVIDEEKTDQQAQKFNRAIMRGFCENGCMVKVVAYRKRYFEKKGIIFEDNIEYNILNSKNFFSTILKSRKKIKEILKNDPDSIIVCDVLNISVTAGALIATKGKNCIGIVTDVPGIYNSGLNAFINNYFINKYSGYVFLAPAMNDLLNHQNKPYVIMEGLYYGKNRDIEVSYKKKKDEKFVVLYAGSLHKKYGIETLVAAFKKIHNKDVELHLYGDGDYVLEIKKNKCNNIIFHGIKENAEVVEAEKQASLLINPRSKNELFTRYSFPSKTIEYMSTGTPVLMQDLPSMPDEYKEYVYLYDYDTADSLCSEILKIKDINESIRDEKGKAAQKFIFKYKNAKVQVAKILNEFGKN